MNNLLKIREKINKAKKLADAKLLATKNGEITPYSKSIFKKRIEETQKKFES